MKHLLALAPLAGLAAAPLNTPPSTTPIGEWTTIVAWTAASEVIVFDHDGAVVARHTVADADVFGPVTSVVDGDVVIRSSEDGAIVRVDLADGTATSYPVPERARARLVRGSSTLLYAMPQLSDELTIVDLARGAAIDVDELWPAGDDVPRVFGEPAADGASEFIAVSDSTSGRTLVVSLDDQSTTVLRGYLVGIVDDTVVTTSRSDTGREIQFWDFNGDLRSSATTTGRVLGIASVGGSIVAVLEGGDLVRMTAEHPAGEPFGHVDLGDDPEPLGIAEIAGDRLLVVADDALKVVSADGEEIHSFTYFGQAWQGFVTAASRCVRTDDIVMDTETGALLPAAALFPVSADGCTYLAAFEPSVPDRIIRDGSMIDLPEDVQVLAISPDGTHAVVRDTEAEAFHLIDLDAPSEFGPALDISAPGVAFLFVER